MVGLAAMAMFLGSLEYVLEEGPRYDWFDDQTIATVAIVVVVGASCFSGAAATAQASRSSSSERSETAILRSGAAFSFAMGIGLYGLTYIYPIYLAPGARL